VVPNARGGDREGGGQDDPGERWAAPGGAFEVAHRRVGARSVLELSGEVDIATVATLQEALEHVGQGSEVVVLDLGGLSFADSSMLAALASACNRLRSQGGDLRLARARGQMRRVLELTGLVELLPPFPSVDQALAGGTGGARPAG